MAVKDDEKVDLAPVLLYARLLRKNHELIARGQGDGPEAEALADLMDEPWYAMTSAEQDRMGGLSIDLYALQEGGPKRVEMSPEQTSAWQQKLKDAESQLDQGQVDPALAFFRGPIPAGLPLHLIPSLQARAWEILGDPETAQLFRKGADRDGLNGSP